MSVLKSETVEEWKESKTKKGGKRKEGNKRKKVLFALSTRCPKSLQMVTAAMKLKDACSLGENL